MTELRKEYQELSDKWQRGKVQAFELVMRCLQIADRPRVQLTDEEIDRIWNEKRSVASIASIADVRVMFARAIIAAYDLKQAEPQQRSVTVRLFQFNNRFCSQTNDEATLPDEWKHVDTFSGVYPLEP